MTDIASPDRLAAIDECIAIVQQTLDTVRAEDDGESRLIKVSIAAREHVIAMLNGYRQREERAALARPAPAAPEGLSDPFAGADESATKALADRWCDVTRQGPLARVTVEEFALWAAAQPAPAAPEGPDADWHEVAGGGSEPVPPDAPAGLEGLRAAIAAEVRDRTALLDRRSAELRAAIEKADGFLTRGSDFNGHAAPDPIAAHIVLDTALNGGDRG
jgi:hypothetical protein